MRVIGKEQDQIPLSKIVAIPPKAYPSTSIEHDDITLLENYIPSASTLDIVDRFSAGLRGSKSGRMLSITGPYGSGKSTMAAFLKGLLAPKKSAEWKAARRILKREPEGYVNTLEYARKKASVHEGGMIVCPVTARREPISATILRALDNGIRGYFGGKTAKFSPAKTLKRYLADLKKGEIPDASKMVELVDAVARSCPTAIIIDEFGKTIEYFASDGSQQGDLFLLQELAERSGKSRRIPLSIVTLQHMAFADYAVGASQTQKQEWAKIQGRFEDIPFANSPEQTRMLVSNTISIQDDAHARKLVKWAERESRVLEDIGVGVGFDPELVASCYPLEPLALEVLPELCSRYGQHERTLLSFIADARKHTVATFIDEHAWNPKNPPTIGLDVLYDYFISGTSMIHSSSANISRLMEIETIIRDAHGLTDMEKKTLKVIGILNLIGRSGYLRASRKMIDCAVRENARAVLKKLEEKSIITYRPHAGEYRIWHGTDINIAAKLDMHRKRYQRAPLSVLLADTISLEPIVAAKHSIETGTMRLFERRFTLSSEEIGENYDGMILYMTDNSTPTNLEKPVITAVAEDTKELRSAAVEVSAIRDILDSDDEVVADWVARRELEERLADAEVRLDREFAESYGESARWSYEKDGSQIPLGGKPSAIVSEVCRIEYRHTPEIRNEMINRTVLSAQGSTAKKRLLEYMLTRQQEPRLGMDGYGPERAIYEALILRNRMHVCGDDLQCRFVDPKSVKMKEVWKAMLSKIKNARGRISLGAVYNVAKMPPYGVKDGPMQIILIAIVMAHQNNIALYEHGTFVPKLGPEAAERMTKNPDHFELKHFKETRRTRALLKQVSSDLKLSGEGILDVVGHLARVVSRLPPHIKTTKNLEKKTVAIRDTILTAREPDTLLFESLPQALGYGNNMSDDEIVRFSATVANSVRNLENGLEDMFGGLCKLLFGSTGMKSRADISRTAKSIKPSVTDRKMKAFLTAASIDTLDNKNDWINYVAMSLTDIPPADWQDDHRDMFENELRAVSAKFKRLAGIHFATVSKNFTGTPVHVTITRADGTEHHTVVSLDPKQKKNMRKITSMIKREMKANGFTEDDVGVLVAELGSRIE